MRIPFNFECCAERSVMIWQKKILHDTVDGRNPAPPGMWGRPWKKKIQPLENKFKGFTPTNPWKKNSIPWKRNLSIQPLPGWRGGGGEALRPPPHMHSQNMLRDSLAVHRIFGTREPKHYTNTGPEKTRGPEDHRTRGPQDQRTKQPRFGSLVARALNLAVPIGISSLCTRYTSFQRVAKHTRPRTCFKYVPKQSDA